MHSSFIDKFWSADLADMQCNKGTQLLLCVVDIFCKYIWVFPLKDKKGITITNVFEEALDEATGKPKKI